MTTSARSHPLRPLVALLGLLAAAVLALGPLAGPAGAHDGDAVITIEAVHPGGQSIHYIVRVTWANDGHPAADATVTATAVAPDGTRLTPAPLAPVDDDGRYAGPIEFPRRAPGRCGSRRSTPPGRSSSHQEVVATATTQAPNVTTGDATDGGFAPADDGTGASVDESGGSTDDAAQAPAADDDTTSGSDDGGFPVLLVAAAAAVVLIGAVTAVNIIRRTRANPPGGPTSEPPSGSDPTTRSSSESTAAAASSDTTSAG